MNKSIIIGGNMSKIIKSGNNSDVYFFNNISIPSINIIDIIDNRLQPGDIGICPDGSTRIVGRDGRFYCDIDPDGDGLYPGTTVKCSNGKTTRVNDRGNIIGGCTPANGSEVTCLADFETIVENGTWSCAQGADGEGLLLDYYTGFNEGGRNAITLISTIIPENGNISIPSYFIGQNYNIQQNADVINQTQAMSTVTSVFNVRGANFLQKVGNLENRKISDIEMVFIPTQNTVKLYGFFFIVYLYRVYIRTELESVESYKINLDGISFRNGEEMTFTKPILYNNLIKNGVFAASVVLGSNGDIGVLELTGNVIIRVHDVPN